MTQRNKKVANSKGKDDNDQQLIIICQDVALNQFGDIPNIPSFCNLKHPRTGQSAIFVFSCEDTRLYEVIKFHEDYRSWFIDNHVQQDGSMLLMSPIDPLFLLLPYLVQAFKSKKFVPLEQLVEDEEFPECRRLCSACQIEELSLIADIKGDDLKAARLNEDKTMSWLKLKVERLANALQRQKIQVAPGSFSESFVQSEQQESRDHYLRYACGMILDYLCPELHEKLQDYLGLPPEPVLKHEKPDLADVPQSKKQKSENVAPLEDYQDNSQKTNAVKPTKMSAAQRSLSKVDKTGMKNISSFFNMGAAKKK